MKKLLLLAVAFVAGFSVMAQQNADQLIQVSSKHDFGKIKQGVPVTTTLEIKNISNKPVVIENAWAGCGCTTPEVTKEPIAAGASTQIKIGYNAAAMGHFDKAVNVKLAGVQDPKIITITGEVLDAAAYDEYVKTEAAKKPSPKADGSKKSTSKVKATSKTAVAKKN